MILSIYSGLLFSLSNSNFSGPHIFRESIANFHNLSRFIINVNWYLLNIMLAEDDFFGRDSKINQAIRNIRSIHGGIEKKLNKRDNKVYGRDVLWINQLGNIGKNYAKYKVHQPLYFTIILKLITDIYFL